MTLNSYFTLYSGCFFQCEVFSVQATLSAYLCSYMYVAAINSTLEPAVLAQAASQPVTKKDLN